MLGREARRGGYGVGAVWRGPRAAPGIGAAAAVAAAAARLFGRPAAHSPVRDKGGVSTCPGTRQGAAKVGGWVGRAAVAAAAAAATATATATAATVAAAHPSDSIRLSPKGASPMEAGGRYKRDARCEMAGREPAGAVREAAERDQGAGMGGQMAAGRPGNAPSKPARPAVRRRAKGMPRSRSFARGWVQALARRGEGGADTCDRACAPSQRHPARAKSPSATNFQVVVACDLSWAPPIPWRVAANFCLPSRCPSSGQPEARRPEKAAEGAAGGVDGPGTRPRPARSDDRLARGTDTSDHGGEGR